MLRLLIMSLCVLLASVDAKQRKTLCEKRVLDDEAVAEMITIITTTNPIPSIPSIKHIYPSQVSLFQIPAFALCKKIIVFDGINPWFRNRVEDYEKYKKRIIKLTETDPYFANTELIFCDGWAHLAGAVGEAIKRVTTPFVFVHQHDFVLTKEFDLNRLVTTMTLNPLIKHVKLNPGYCNRAYAGATYDSGWDGPVDEVVEGPHCVPLCRCFGWSDNDHIARTDYYTDFVLPMCSHGAMEWFLQPALKASLAEFGDAGHAPFGTYLYGRLQDGGYIRHSDGREAWGVITPEIEE